MDPPEGIFLKPETSSNFRPGYPADSVEQWLRRGPTSVTSEKRCEVFRAKETLEANSTRLNRPRGRCGDKRVWVLSRHLGAQNLPQAILSGGIQGLARRSGCGGIGTRGVGEETKGFGVVP